MEIELSKFKELLFTLKFELTEDQKHRFDALFRYAEKNPDKMENYINNIDEYYCQLGKQKYNKKYSLKLVKKSEESCAKRDLVSEFKEIERQIEERMNKELTTENISEINKLQIKLVQIEEQMTEKDLNRLKDYGE
ncbi:MAG: hypothetical protein UIG52_00565 [Bacteroidales bacterium]|nr:hypothetical protein [Bacteroidales bacterium]